MVKFNNILKGGIGRILVSTAGMVAGKVIADKMTKKALKEQTGFESVEEIMADAQKKAAQAQAEAEAQARASMAQTTEK